MPSYRMRQSGWGKSNKLLEGEIHYGNGCAYFVFHNAEGKPQFANKLGTFGVDFFNKIITQFEGK